MAKNYKIYLIGEGFERQQAIGDDAVLSDASFVLDGKIDMIERVSNSLKSKVTKLPIEDGSVITDHIRETPTEITILAAVSNLNRSQAAAEAASNIIDAEFILTDEFLSAEERVLVEGIADDLDKIAPAERPSGAIQALDKYRKAGNLFFVGTRLHSYENMIITSLDFTEDFRSNGALFVKIGMTQVNVVDTIAAEPLGLAITAISTDEQHHAKIRPPIESIPEFSSNTVNNRVDVINQQINF